MTCICHVCRGGGHYFDEFTYVIVKYKLKIALIIACIN